MVDQEHLFACMSSRPGVVAPEYTAVLYKNMFCTYTAIGCGNWSASERQLLLIQYGFIGIWGLRQSSLRGQ